MSLPRGTIVYRTDPFKDAASGRPWLIINTPEMPFHGEQYIALNLSTRTWYDERLPLDTDDLLEGGLSPLSVTGDEPEPAHLFVASFERLETGCKDDVATYAAGSHGNGSYTRVSFIETGTETETPLHTNRTHVTSRRGSNDVPRVYQLYRSAPDEHYHYLYDGRPIPARAAV